MVERCYSFRLIPTRWKRRLQAKRGYLRGNVSGEGHIVLLSPLRLVLRSLCVGGSTLRSKGEGGDAPHYTVSSDGVARFTESLPSSPQSSLSRALRQLSQGIFYVSLKHQAPDESWCRWHLPFQRPTPYCDHQERTRRLHL